MIGKRYQRDFVLIIIKGDKILMVVAIAGMTIGQMSYLWRLVTCSSTSRVKVKAKVNIRTTPTSNDTSSVQTLTEIIIIIIRVSRRIVSLLIHANTAVATIGTMIAAIGSTSPLANFKIWSSNLICCP